MITLRIITPDAELFCGTVQAVFLPGTAGEFEVLLNHAPIVSSLEEGYVRYRMDGKEHRFKIASGFVKSRNNIMTVCVEL